MTFMSLSTVIKVCFDTNVFISAFIFSGKPAEIFDLAVDSKIVLVASPAILSEIARVLRHKFKRDEFYIKRQLKIISDVSEIVIPKKKITILNYNPDNKILEAAVVGNVNYIVTGDKKHLLPLKEFKGISLLTPERFLKIFKQSQLAE